MDSGVVGGQQLTTFIAGDDATAKAQVMQMARDIGFDTVDAGPLQAARLLEPLGYFNIQLGYVLGLGTQIGLKLAARSAPPMLRRADACAAAVAPRAVLTRSSRWS